MQIADNRFLDDLAHLLSGAATTLVGIRSELEGLLQQQLEKFITSMNLVSREEFSALRSMIQSARNTQEDIERELVSMRNQLSSEERRTNQPFQLRQLRRRLLLRYGTNTFRRKALLPRDKLNRSSRINNRSSRTKEVRHLTS